MNEEIKRPEEAPEEKPEKKDLRKNRSPNGAFGFRMAAILVVLYMLFQVVQGYVKGGPDAPSLGLLILAIVILGGGSVGIGIMSYRTWMQENRKQEPEAETDKPDADSEAGDAPAEDAPEDEGGV